MPLKRKTKGRPSEIDIYVGARILEARKTDGMTQHALGDGLDLTFQQIQKYERGLNRISAGRIAAISKIFGLPIAWFFPPEFRTKSCVRIDVLNEINLDLNAELKNIEEIARNGQIA